MIGTKFDTFSTFPRDEQEEITKQACSYCSLAPRYACLTGDVGEALRKGDACLAHILLNISLDQRAEDLQDRPGEGVRPEMRHPGNRRRGRANTNVCRRIVHEEDDDPRD